MLTCLAYQSNEHASKHATTHVCGGRGGVPSYASKHFSPFAAGFMSAEVCLGTDGTCQGGKNVNCVDAQIQMQDVTRVAKVSPCRCWLTFGFVCQH